MVSREQGIDSDKQVWLEIEEDHRRYSLALALRMKDLWFRGVWVIQKHNLDASTPHILAGVTHLVYVY